MACVDLHNMLGPKGKINIKSKNMIHLVYYTHLKLFLIERRRLPMRIN